jgi:hypothetical protein
MIAFKPRPKSPTSCVKHEIQVAKRQRLSTKHSFDGCVRIIAARATTRYLHTNYPKGVVANEGQAKHYGVAVGTRLYPDRETNCQHHERNRIVALILNLTRELLQTAGETP